MATIVCGAPADEIFRTGPENTIAESPIIVAGPISNYSRQVLKFSQPGPNGVPLEWTVSGEIRPPQVLKGQPVIAPLRFSKHEGSFMFDDPRPSWQAEYGDLASDAQAVVFMQGRDAASITSVLPSRTAEQDLITLVLDIIGIQAFRDPADRTGHWLVYASQAPSDTGRKAALRSLLNSSIEWKRFETALQALLTNADRSENIRAFGFGLVTFGIVEQKLPADIHGPVDLLCRVFFAEPDPDLVIQYIQNLKLVLRYADEEEFRDRRRPLRDIIMDCISRRVSATPSATELKEEYDRIRAQYP